VRRILDRFDKKIKAVRFRARSGKDCLRDVRAFVEDGKANVNDIRC
jgi:hypothetical protein